MASNPDNRCARKGLGYGPDVEVIQWQLLDDPRGVDAVRCKGVIASPHFRGIRASAAVEDIAWSLRGAGEKGR